VQAGQRVEQQSSPLNAAVARVEDDAGAAAAGQFLAAGDPADVGIEEVQAAERGADAGRLAFPVLAAVDGVPDDALVADGPAFAVVHELDAAEGGVGKVANLGGRGGRHEGERQQKSGKREGSHERSSRDRGGDRVRARNRREGNSRKRQTGSRRTRTSHPR
jgi:hypothetical protein